MPVLPTGVLKFLGASVMTFSQQANWQEGASTCTIQLVEDLSNGDSFTSGTVGAPYSFNWGSGRFDGLLQRVTNSKSPAGFTYTVDLVSPNELLVGTQVITNSFASPISGIANLYNVFGYYENTLGFNGAQANSAGMYWNSQKVSVSGSPFATGVSLTITSGSAYGIKPGIEYIQDNPGLWGSGIYYKGHHYRINFSGLPSPPSFYRLGGQGAIANVADFVAQICNDAGADWIVTLTTSGVTEGNTIGFKTISRTTQLPLNSISNFMNSQSGAIVSSEVGYENVNDNTNLFIIGANQQILMTQSNVTNPNSIIPFFGLDGNGYPVVGTGDEDHYTVDVYAAPIADILGGYSYTLNMKEMRLALGSEDMWAAYLYMTKPALAHSLGIPTMFALDDGATGNLLTPAFSHDFIQQNTTAAINYARIYQSDIWANNFYRVLNFVRTHALENYGRRFLVKTPVFIQAGVEAETNRLIYSHDIIDGGATVDGLAPLGLNSTYSYYFLNSDNTYGHLVRIPNANSGDPSSVANTKFVGQGSYVYMPCRVMTEYGILYNGTFNAIPSYVVIELENPLYRLATDGLGGVDQLNALFGTDISYAEQIRNTAFAGLYHPAPMFPDSVAFAVRDNRYTYGPWFSSGPPGRVEIRQDVSLSPWNYGGYNVMNAIASAEVDNFASNLQVIETGNVQVPGMPQVSIGDSLVSNGPIVTDMQTSAGTNGVVTTYNMRTYTPRKGRFLREYIRRLQVISQSAVQLGRTLGELYSRRVR
jgi:hypothetical protein